MSIKEEIEKHIGKIVIIGVPHSFDAKKLFFYKGDLITADDNLIKLECSNGPVFISIDRIKEFREERHTQPRSDDV